eukprot:5163439-Alexandrium_andersonii.AAC.1
MITLSAARTRLARGDVPVLTPLGTARQCRLALLAVAPALELLREGASGVLSTRAEDTRCTLPEQL